MVTWRTEHNGEPYNNLQLQTNLALLQFSGSFYSHSYFIVVSKFSSSYWVIRAEECMLPCVLPESIHVITFLIQSRLQPRNLLKGFKIMVYNVGKLSPPYIAIRKPHNFSISRILLHGFRKDLRSRKYDLLSSGLCLENATCTSCNPPPDLIHIHLHNWDHEHCASWSWKLCRQ